MYFTTITFRFLILHKLFTINDKIVINKPNIKKNISRLIIYIQYLTHIKIIH